MTEGRRPRRRARAGGNRYSLFFLFFDGRRWSLRSKRTHFFSRRASLPRELFLFSRAAAAKKASSYLTGAEYSGREHVASRLPSSTRAEKRDDDGALVVAATLPSPPPLAASARSWARSWAIRAETSSREKEEEGAASPGAAAAGAAAGAAAAAEGAILKNCLLLYRKKREKK